MTQSSFDERLAVLMASPAAPPLSRLGGRLPGSFTDEKSRAGTASLHWGSPLRRFCQRMSILLLVALAFSQRGLAQKKYPTLEDLFAGRARFQGTGEHELVGLNFNPLPDGEKRHVYGQKFAFFENPDEPNVVYAATRGNRLLEYSISSS